MPSKKRANIEGSPIPVLAFDNQPEGSSSKVELLTIPEVAALLRISPTGVRRLQHGRLIPFIKVGNNVRFIRSDLLKYLQKMRVEPIGE